MKVESKQGRQMEFIGAVIFILFFAIISVPIANRLRLPLEIFLVIGSGIISLTPGISSFELNPKLVFNILLPPILFYAAYFTSWHEFKFNIRPISLLAIGLVLFTMLIVAIVAKWIFSQLTWPECFLLGAIISPTDAASATSIIKKLGAPRRVITILEGESLINDATALIAFRFSLGAVIAGSFSLSQASLQFFTIATGGLIIGLLIAVISVFILRKLNSTTAETTLTFITAFSAYLFADHLNLSGVISTVACGIYFGLRFPEISSSKSRIHAKASWDTLIFIINGLAFALIGLELPVILKKMTYHNAEILIFYGIIISVVIMIARIIWVFLMAHLSRLFFPVIARTDPTPPWPTLFILGWCGMRGIISLAAALSIPLYISNVTPFPHRDLILFITYCVIVITLILPAFSLPFFLRIFHLTNSENKMKQEALARIKSLEGIIEKLHELKIEEKIPDDIFIEYRKQIERRLQVLQTQLDDIPYSTLNKEYQALKALTFTGIESERNTLFKLRKSGEINDEIFHLLLEELDLEELRAKTLRV